MIRKLVRGVAWFVLGFVGLFAVRLAVGPGALGGADGYLGPALASNLADQNRGSQNGGPRNIASSRYEGSKLPSKYESRGGGGSTGQKGVASVDQKYEKVASLSTRSTDFAGDEQRLRGAVSSHKGVIQVEQSSGLEGSRYLYLGIGVPPDRFEGLIADVRKIGKVSSIQVTKKDKTNEYQDMNAQRVSLEKSRTALVGLKAQGGKLEEMVNLEKRLLELEESIQKLGVRLGEFDTENEFVTVQATLLEARAQRPVSLITRAYEAFEWTVKYYFAFVCVLFFSGLSVLVGIALLEKLAWIPAAMREPAGKG